MAARHRRLALGAEPVGLLSRLTYVRGIGLDPALAETVHERRFSKLVREGAVAPAFLLSDYSVSRRRATLAAQVIDLEARLSDAAVQMFKQVGELFAKARAAQKRHNVAGARDVGRLVRLFDATLDALTTAKEGGLDALDAIDEAVGWDRLTRNARRSRWSVLGLRSHRTACAGLRSPRDANFGTKTEPIGGTICARSRSELS